MAIRSRFTGLCEVLLNDPKNSKLLHRPNKAGETPYSIDLQNKPSILSGVFNGSKDDDTKYPNISQAFSRSVGIKKKKPANLKITLISNFLQGDSEKTIEKWLFMIEKLFFFNINFKSVFMFILPSLNAIVFIIIKMLIQNKNSDQWEHFIKQSFRPFYKKNLKKIITFNFV